MHKNTAGSDTMTYRFRTMLGVMASVTALLAERPLRQIVSNAGEAAAVVLNQVKGGKGAYGCIALPIEAAFDAFPEPDGVRAEAAQ